MFYKDIKMVNSDTKIDNNTLGAVISLTEGIKERFERQSSELKANLTYVNNMLTLLNNMAIENATIDTKKPLQEQSELFASDLPTVNQVGNVKLPTTVNNRKVKKFVAKKETVKSYVGKYLISCKKPNDDTSIPCKDFNPRTLQRAVSHYAIKNWPEHKHGDRISCFNEQDNTLEVIR